MIYGPKDDGSYVVEFRLLHNRSIAESSWSSETVFLMGEFADNHATAGWPVENCGRSLERQI
jgi:hypothetical protein